MNIQLILPTPAYKEAVLSYKEEFLHHGDSMDGTGGLRNASTFEEWLSLVMDNTKEETVRPNLVRATTYLAVNESNHVVGMIDIRHRLNEYLFQFGGHIGYSVRKSERQKGYASEMLRLALVQCRKIGLRKVLITCDKQNIASAKTILRNGGIFENELPEEDAITLRYWITL